ncbi:MAG: hypothetical protein OES38_03135 [Gammaproteobacteria bacterium]|nr:hypothetical protein [Gammaproteobacteria bacterium]
MSYSLRQFEYGFPRWGQLCLLGFAGLISIISGVSAYRGAEWNPDQEAWLEYALWAICIVMAGFVFMPRRREWWVQFVADRSGIRFHTHGFGAERNRWLRLNWDKIGRIWLGPYNRRSRSSAFVIEIQVTDLEIEGSFSNIAMAKRMFRHDLRNADGFLELRFNNPFHNSEKAVERLEALRSD